MSDPLPTFPTSEPMIGGFPARLWIRMPYGKRGKGVSPEERAEGALCKVTSMKRGKLERLCVPSIVNQWNPPVLSVSMAEPGQKRAVRLIYLPSLNEYLIKLAKEQAAEAAKKHAEAKAAEQQKKAA